MQVMPNTLRGFNIPDSMHMNPKANIMAATELLRALEKRYRYIRNPKERINFVLASYNAGYGHIQDAMQLAKKHGKNRFVWNNSVDSFLIYKSKPEYYTDSICRNGQFTGWRETLSFVKKVNRNWKRFERMQQEYTDSINIVVTNDSTKRIAQ
jgi:membrane-bound lytic murein transglycosylase F